MLNITKKIQADATVIALSGRLDTNTAPQLDNEVKSVDDGNIVMDLADLVYVSSAGLRVFLSAQKRMISKGEMKLINVQEGVMEILEVTGFTDILNIE